VNAIIFGPPGSGKGTYASRLQSRLGVAVIAMGDIFREILKEDTPLGKKVKDYVEAFSRSSERKRLHFRWLPTHC
jgi:adenylate kinase